MADNQASRPPLDLARIEGAVPPWASVEVVEETGSTNADLLARAGSGVGEGLVLVAEHQRSGRGRLDRSWEAPARAGLTFSLLVRPGEVPARRWPWLPLLTGVAVVEGLTAAGGPPCTLKWPNDVLLDGRKVGGLLVERTGTPSGPAAVVGIGINVTTSSEELPVPSATSLALAGATGMDRSALLGAVVTAFAGRYDGWRAGRGTEELHATYSALCATVGREVEVHLPGGTAVRATASGVDRDGALVLESAEGRRVVTAGDVVHVRRVG